MFRLFIAVWVAGAIAAQAEIQPAGIFTDGAVLQQKAPVRIWGSADPGEKVTVEFALQKKSTKADAAGKWMVTLDPLPASSKPRKMTISSDSNHPAIQYANLLVGEVWLAGGQSNMASTMHTYRKTTQSDIDHANDPLLRMVTIPRLEYAGQNKNLPQWKPTAPEHTASFSASAYYFAKNLRETLQVPVGIITCCVGATPAEAWMSRETLSSTPSLKRILDAYDLNVQEKYQDLEVYLRLAEERETNLKAWHEKRKAKVKPLPPYPVEVMGPRNYKRPGGLHETMLTQTLPYTLRGAIWYQGENNANAGAGFHYRTVFPALIEEWRTEFMNPNMPFLFVQLATFGPAHDESPYWPELREAQSWTEDHVENSGMIVLADGGEINDIHPHSKKKTGTRLARLARNMTYRESELICRGPRVQNITRAKNHIELLFKKVGSGLILEPTENSPFEICGEDKQYVQATAKLDGEKLMISADGIANPQHVRYGWRKWFEPTLFNKEGLPASPFRTDNFKPITEGRHYLDQLLAVAKAGPEPATMIPTPGKMEALPGFYNPGPDAKINLDGTFSKHWNISFQPLEKDLGDEGYQLDIAESGVTIRSKAKAGKYYALISLKQLSELAVDGNIPCVKIEDQPKFEWRSIRLMRTAMNSSPHTINKPKHKSRIKMENRIPSTHHPIFLKQ